MIETNGDFERPQWCMGNSSCAKLETLVRRYPHTPSIWYYSSVQALIFVGGKQHQQAAAIPQNIEDWSVLQTG